MAAPFQLLLVLPGGAPAREAILTVHACAAARGAALDPTDLALNQLPEGVAAPGMSSAAAALEGLIGWPSLGSLTYRLGAGELTVFYPGRAGDGRVYARLLSFWGAGSAAAEALAAALGTAFPAGRLVAGWDLERAGVSWVEELGRLERRGERAL